MVPVVLWVTFDSFCKHIYSLTVLPVIYQMDPLFCNREKENLKDQPYETNNKKTETFQNEK